MKKYTLYLYLNYNNCRNITDDPRECLITDCLTCKENHYYIKNQENKKIFESSRLLQTTTPNNHLEKYEIEVLDNQTEDNFIAYLTSPNSNYRIIDPEVNNIIRYSNEDLEIVSDLIEKYGDASVNLYNITNKEELKPIIKNLKIHKSISSILSGGFTLTTLLTTNSLIKDAKFIFAILSGASIICLIQNLKTLRQDNIDIELNKRLIRKLPQK